MPGIPNPHVDTSFVQIAPRKSIGQHGAFSRTHDCLERKVCVRDSETSTAVIDEDHVT